MVEEQSVLRMYVEMYGKRLEHNVPFGVLYDSLREDDEE